MKMGAWFGMVAVGMAMMLGNFGGCMEVQSPMGVFAGTNKAALAEEKASPMVVAAPVENEKGVALASDTGVVGPGEARLVIYNATINLVVPDIEQTLRVIQLQAKSCGGYMQEISGNAITVRIPVAKFEGAIAAYEKLGEVASRMIKAQDITEEMHDLAIRLGNAEAMRKRLLELVEKSQNVEDTLKIEQELRRVTETLELLKGRIQFLSTQVAFSTLRIELNSPLPQKQVVAQIPFAWVRSLADGAVTGNAEGAPDTSRWRRRGIGFELPPTYIRYYELDQTTEALSANGVLIKVRRQDNYEGGSLAFWSALAHRALVENRGFAIGSEVDTALDNKTAAKQILASRDAGGRKTGYMLGIVVNKRYVYTYEAWGELGEFTKDEAALVASFKSMKVN